MPEILDLTSSAPQKKPIKLVACLQSQKRKEWESYYFLNSNYDQYLKDAKLVKRLVKLEFPAYSGEICELSLINVDNVIFLGEWNDGVVGE